MNIESLPVVGILTSGSLTLLMLGWIAYIAKNYVNKQELKEHKRAEDSHREFLEKTLERLARTVERNSENANINFKNVNDKFDAIMHAIGKIEGKIEK